MDKRFLIIGDKTISNAVVQVMTLFVSHQFVCLDTDGCSNVSHLIGNLEKHKDAADISGLIMFDTDGIEFAKHIRLTPTLGNLSLLPIVVVSQSPLENLLRENRDNIFLLSPEVYVIDLSSLIPDLIDVIRRVKTIESTEKMRADLKPFIVWSEEDDIISSHDNFNRYGPFKLIKERFGSLPEPLSGLYEGMTKRLWFKKYKLLEDKRAPVAVPIEFDNVDFKKAISNKRILYIDDEHRLGWSFALYSIVTESCKGDIFTSFEEPGHRVLSSNSRLTCIDSYSEAESLIAEYGNRLSTALSEYSELEAKKNDLEEQRLILKQKLTIADADYKKAIDVVERLEANQIEITEKQNSLTADLNEALHSLLGTWASIQGEPGVEDMSGDMGNLTGLYPQWIEKRDLGKKIREDLDSSRKRLKECQDVHEQSKTEHEKISTEKAEVGRKYDEVIKQLDPKSLFPYDLIILDLRLEKEKDKDASAEEISGIRLLGEIKKVDPGIPVIVFTASEKALNYKTVKELGASGYWIKAVNTAVELMAEMIKAMRVAEEVRPLWHDIKKIEAKKQLLYVFEDKSGRNDLLRESVMHGSTKGKVVSLLKESFLLCLSELSPFEESVYRYNNYSKIALNMGLIQAERYKSIEDEEWNSLVKTKKVGGDEVFIRRKRNDVAHHRQAVSAKDALDAFRITLKKCLEPKLL